MNFRQAVPAVVTMVALACGLAALEAAQAGAWGLTLRLILLAAIADGLDGTLARWLRATSAMGEQLDSLADVVAFGVAPAVLFSTYYGRAPDALRYGVALAFVLAGAYRLARFHSQPADGVFRGLPITVAGPLLTATVAGPFNAGVRPAGAVGIGLAALMACHLQFPTFVPSHRWLVSATAMAVLTIALWPRVETLAVVAVLILGIYVVWGLVGRVVDDDLWTIDHEVRERVGPRP